MPALGPVHTAWVRRYNGPGNGTDVLADLTIDGSGYAYVTGSAFVTGLASDYATIKYAPNGDTVWLRRYNGPGNYDDNASAVAVDALGNVYVTGSSARFGTGNVDYDYATLKYDPSGNSIWVARYDGPGDYDDNATAIAVDDEGNVYVTGISAGAGTGSDFATIKYSPLGDTLWTRRYNGTGNGTDEAWDLALDAGHNVYVTGRSRGSGSDDYATVKYSSSGELLWTARYDGPVIGDNCFSRSVTIIFPVSPPAGVPSASLTAPACSWAGLVPR